MKKSIKYIEHKPAEHTDRGNAWIAHVWHSASGKTLYFNNMALKRINGADSNHYDFLNGESYWVSGVKKQGSMSRPDIGCHIKDMKTYIRRL